MPLLAGPAALNCWRPALCVQDLQSAQAEDEHPDPAAERAAEAPTPDAVYAAARPRDRCRSQGCVRGDAVQGAVWSLQGLPHRLGPSTGEPACVLPAAALYLQLLLFTRGPMRGNGTSTGVSILPSEPESFRAAQFCSQELRALSDRSALVLSHRRYCGFSFELERAPKSSNNPFHIAQKCLHGHAWPCLYPALNCMCMHSTAHASLLQPGIRQAYSSLGPIRRSPVPAQQYHTSALPAQMQQQLAGRLCNTAALLLGCSELGPGCCRPAGCHLPGAGRDKTPHTILPSEPESFRAAQLLQD